MAYDALVERLADPPDASVSAFPDGSVDTRFRVSHGEEEIDTRRRLGEQISDGEFDSYRLHSREATTGGQAPNAAEQAAALGADTALAGHLDHELFSYLSCSTYSMGEPATVSVFELEDGDVMFAAESHDIEAWTLEDLLDVVPEEFFHADAAFGGNWVSIPAMTGALESLDEHLSCETFVFDPGNLTGYDESRIRDLCAALSGTCSETVLSLNRAETNAVADAFGVDGDGETQVRGIASETGLTAVCHGATAALLATPERFVRVPNLDVGTPVRQAGGGDRFGGGLAVARGAGWEWETALACGNACASRFVATGETGSRDAVREFVARAMD